MRVSYGHEHPEPRRPAVGGIVKLQHLSAVFPEESRRFNVLYLVSSRLPDGAVALAAWAHRKGARVVLNQNGVAYPAWYGRAGSARTRRWRAASLADHVFYQSCFCRESADRFAGPAAGRARFSTTLWTRRRFVPASSRRHRPLTLLLAGSQDQWYRLESAVRALAALVRGGLDAAADRDRSSPLDARRRCRRNARRQRSIQSLGLESRVELTGPYSQAEAPAIFHARDILLHTKYNDPCPTVVVEGLATGLPVVYSASGGVPELVGDDAGIGIPAERSWDVDIPPDPEEVAAAVDRVWRDRERFARAARDRAVARFDVASWLAPPSGCVRIAGFVMNQVAMSASRPPR